MEAAGASFAKLNKIIVTHQDIDHIGDAKYFFNRDYNKIIINTIYYDIIIVR